MEIMKLADTGEKILRKAIYRVFEGRCYYTKKKLRPDNFDIDHVLPLAEGGEDTIDNYVLCCPSYNRRMGPSYDSNEIQSDLQVVREYYAPRVYQEMVSLYAIERQAWYNQYKERAAKPWTKNDMSCPDTLAQDALNIGVDKIPCLLMYTAIPYRRWLCSQTESRRMGKVKLFYRTPKNTEAPSGIYARLILALICKKVAQERKTTIKIEESVRGIARELGQISSRGSFPRYGLQRSMWILSRSEMVIETPHSSKTIKLMENPVILKQGAQVQLSAPFYEMALGASPGKRMSTLRKIGTSPLKFDLCILSQWYTFNQQPSLRIPWEHLRMRLGTQVRGRNGFRAYLRQKLFEVRREGLRLFFLPDCLRYNAPRPNPDS